MMPSAFQAIKKITSALENITSMIF